LCPIRCSQFEQIGAVMWVTPASTIRHTGLAKPFIAVITLRPQRWLQPFRRPGTFIRGVSPRNRYGAIALYRMLIQDRPFPAPDRLRDSTLRCSPIQSGPLHSIISNMPKPRGSCSANFADVQPTPYRFVSLTLPGRNKPLGCSSSGHLKDERMHNFGMAADCLPL
jgi:hypothetical protein